MGIAVEGDELPVVADLDEMQARWFHGNLPFRKVLAVLVEDLDAVVVAVVDEDAPRLDVDRNPVNVVHVTRPGFLSRIAGLAEVQEEIAIRVELGDARAVVA